MRKVMVLGLLTLLFSSFTSSLLAGNVEDCEFLKQSGQKSLYGLCVAWHNADEDAKPGLADKFLDRAGYPVPGSEVAPPPAPDPEPDFACPCWSDVSFADICALGSPTIADVTSTTADVAYFDFISFTIEGFGAQSTPSTPIYGCAHTIQDLDSGGYLLNIQYGDLTQDEALDCLAEATVIASMYNGGGCD